MKDKHLKHYRNLGQGIAYYRMQRNLNQRELAELLHVKQPYISKIEGGSQGMTYDQIIEFAEALDVPVYILTMFIEKSQEE